MREKIPNRERGFSTFAYSRSTRIRSHPRGVISFVPGLRRWELSTAMLPSPTTRRRFLRQSFCFSAALGLSRVLPPGAWAAEAAGDHFILAIGDFGSDDEKQQAVARGMIRHGEESKRKPDALWLLGDNFYKPMPGGVKSERWQRGFEAMYPAAHFPGPCWAVLGNHDYHDEAGGEKAQLTYAKATPGTRWTLPAKWYRLDFPSLNPLVTFLCLDSNLPSPSGWDEKLGAPRPSLTAAEVAEQQAWFQAELAKPRAAYTAVVAHHPLFTNGQHGDSKPLIAAWDGLLREHGVQFYFCGHDHDLQHLEFEGHPTSFVISGGGGARARELKKMDRGPFGKAIYGFTELQFNAERFIVRHFDANRALLHTFSKTAAGRMQVG